MDVICTPFDSPLLPPRQLEILQLARRGTSFQDITTHLGISANTLRWYVSQIRRVLPAFDTVETVATPDPDRLTAREQEVALLVAEGFSNTAISQHLTVSLNTVEYHLKQLYRKTGARTRVQLANVARTSLLPTTVGLAHAEG